MASIEEIAGALTKEFRVSKLKNTQNPTWEYVNIGENLLNKDSLDAIREKLDLLESFLQKVESILDVVKAFIGIIRAFETLVNDLFFGLIVPLLESFRRIVDSAKYTGIYFLDLVSHNRFYDEPYLKLCYPETNTTNFLYLDSMASFAEENADDIGRFGGLLNPALTTNKIFGDTLSNKQETDSVIFFNTQTYEEWIETAVQAFQDINDVADKKTLASLIQARDNNSLNKSDNLKTSDLLSTEVYRPGRPQLGNDASMRVYVICSATPDFSVFFKEVAVLLRFLSGPGGLQLNDLAQMLADSYNYLFGDDEDEDEDNNSSKKKNKNKKKNQLIKSISEMGDSFYESFKSLKDVPAGIDNSFSRSGGDEPDFYGISVYQLIPQLFDTIDNLINALTDLFDKVSSSFGDAIEYIIGKIQEKIDSIKEAIRAIRSLINLIEQILATGFYYLKFETNEGNFGVIKGLRSAEGFPLKGTNTPIYIGGYLMAYGYPNTGENLNNLSEFYRKRTKQLESRKNSLIDDWDRNANILDELFS